MTAASARLLAAGILVGQSSSLAKRQAYLTGIAMMEEYLATECRVGVCALDR